MFLRIWPVMLLLLSSFASADVTVDVYLFWRDGCPHCEREIAFLDKISQRNQSIKLHKYEISKNSLHREWFERVATHFNTDATSVPFTIIGDAVVIGYGNDEDTGKLLSNRIEYCLVETCPDSMSRLISGHSALEKNITSEKTQSSIVIPETVRFPLIGDINIKSLSLPLLTIVLGALDGFNPCAMWALIFLLGIVIGIKEPIRRWTFGIVFIAVSALVYFLFMAAWLNVFLFAGSINWVRGLIGVAALAGGIYYLREFIIHPVPVCKVSSNERRRSMFEKLKEMTQGRHFYSAILGITALAIAVNAVEMVCSAGIPAIFTQVLAMSDLPRWQYYFYLVVYIVVFMLDDLFVFIVAMTTLQITGITAKYSRYSHLIGGIILLLIALLLWFKPEWLTFSL